MRMRTLFLAPLVMFLASGLAASKSYNTPTIDGNIKVSAVDWDSDEFVYNDADDDCRYYPTDPDLDDLFVTWDADSLYVGFRTENGPGTYGNGYLLFIDTDVQNGITGATDFAEADFYGRRIRFRDPATGESTMGADVIMGGWAQPGQYPTFEVKHCSEPTSTTPLEGYYAAWNPGWMHAEVGIAWNGIFGLGEGVVPAGTRIRVLTAVVGGGTSGAYDAMPTSSTGIESDPATPWDAYTDLDQYVEVPVDADEDGVPDEGYPPSGAISGTVTLDDPGDSTTVVTLTVYQDTVAVRQAETHAGGGTYTISRLPDGIYDVVATAPSYLDSTAVGISIEDEAEVPNVDFLLTKVTGRIVGEVSLAGGPAVDVTVAAYDTLTGEMGGDGPHVVVGGSGTFSIGTVVDGSYRVEATALGYVEAEKPAVVADGDTAQVGLFALDAAVATEYSFVDSTGRTIYAASTTASIPDSGIYYFARAWIEPRDEGDRHALWDYEAQDGISLSVTRLDPAFQPDGYVILADTNGVPLPEPTLTADMFVDGRAGIFVADDRVEILRLLASKGDTIEGVLEVGIASSAPTRLALTADVQVITAGEGTEPGVDAARITGQLKDSSGNDASVSGISAEMVALGVGGDFSVGSPDTDPNGRFELDFSGTAAGVAVITATIDPSSPYANITADTLRITLEPDEPTLVAVDASPSALPAGGSATIAAQVVDEFGNSVELPDLSIDLTATPAHLVESLDTPIETDESGLATGVLEAGTGYGVIELSGEAGALDVETVFIPVDATIVAIDETAPESDEDHNSNPDIDLTIMHAANDSSELVVSFDFSSGWDGVHLALVVETKGDAFGATDDPFVFPISYGHTLLPDYVFTYKYAGEDYADLRRWTGSQWEYWNLVAGVWTTDETSPDKNAVSWITKGPDLVSFRMPLSVIEAGVGTAVLLEGYVMQEFGGNKYTALDSSPHDATHDMEPETGEWYDTATNPVTLGSYATYVVTEAGFPPMLSEGDATPDPAEPGDLVTYTVRVTDGGSGVGDVLLDLSEVGGPSLVRMLDDGEGADGTAGDQVYSAEDTLSAAASDGDHTVLVTARDELNISSATLGVGITVDNPSIGLRRFDDPVGDDHGPNKVDGDDNPIEELYYYYPTNRVFRPGSFDITSVEIYADGEWLVFRTHVENLVSHQEAGAADWGAPQPSEQTCDDPFRTDLNLQKIDIYIDAREAQGATSGFPDRYVDVAAVDAWDYGIAIEGWGKWFVISNDSNSQASWALYKSDSDIRICNNHAEDWIDVRVRSALFEGADADIDKWDIIVCLSSHDGETNDENLGGIRWVNANRAEWQFWGGRDGEAGRERDANIVDVAASPGEEHEPGRPQEEMLDYTTPEALERFANDKIAVVIEASFAEDYSPPVITPFTGDPDVEHIPWVALEGAPAVFWTGITDASEIDVARFYWHPIGDSVLRRADMVELTGGLWAADVKREDIVSATSVINVPKTGDARLVVGWIFARDASANGNQIWAGPYEMAIPEPWPPSQTIAGIDSLLPAAEDYPFIFQDGTIAVMEAGFPEIKGRVDLVLTTVGEGVLDLGNVRDDMTFLGVARDIRLDTDEGSVTSTGWPWWLFLHYPQYDVGPLDEGEFGVFRWVDETDRWILAGGYSSPSGNVTAGIVRDLGLFGVFHWEGLEAGDTRGLSGVLAEPNPFSPNGDGIYDETSIFFYIGREADHVNVEFFDLTGRLVRRLKWQAPTFGTGRSLGEVVWDGTDGHGHVVPYGIYIMRVEAKFKTSPTYERVNTPVVIVK